MLANVDRGATWEDTGVRQRGLRNKTDNRNSDHTSLFSVKLYIMFVNISCLTKSESGNVECTGRYDGRHSVCPGDEVEE